MRAVLLGRPQHVLKALVLEAIKSPSPASEEVCSEIGVIFSYFKRPSSLDRAFFNFTPHVNIYPVSDRLERRRGQHSMPTYRMRTCESISVFLREPLFPFHFFLMVKCMYPALDTGVSLDFRPLVWEVPLVVFFISRRGGRIPDFTGRCLRNRKVMYDERNNRF